MTSKAKSSNASERSGGFMSFLQASYKTGMGAAEGLQQAGMEVPLAMLEVIGVPKEKTDVLRDKNRQMVHGMISGIENIAGKFVEVGVAEVGLAAGAIKQARAPKKAAPKAEKES